MMFTFDTFKGLVKGPTNEHRLKCLLLISACFCIGTFVASTLTYTFAPNLEAQAVEFLGGAVFGSLVAALKLSAV